MAGQHAWPQRRGIQRSIAKEKKSWGERERERQRQRETERDRDRERQIERACVYAMACAVSFVRMVFGVCVADVDDHILHSTECFFNRIVARSPCLCCAHMYKCVSVCLCVPFVVRCDDGGDTRACSLVFGWVYDIERE